MNTHINLLRRSTLVVLGFGALACSLFVFNLPQAEAAVVRSGDSISVAEDSVVKGDFYATGNNITISGIIEGDAYVLGGTVTINGIIKGDLLALGGTVYVHGKVEDDVRALGGKIVIAETTGGDVVAAGGSLNTLSTAHVEGDLLFYGLEMKVEGEVKGEVHARTETLAVNGTAGSIDAILSGPLTLEQNARIGGDISYQSSDELSRAPDAVVGGTINRKTEVEERESLVDAWMPVWFMALFASLVSVLLFKNRLLRMFTMRGHALALSGGLGLAVVVAVPAASFLLMASVLGSLAGVFLLFVYGALILGALILMHVFAGALLAKYIVKEYKVTWLWTLAGVALVQAAIQIPVVGVIAGIILFAITLGMLVHYLYLSVRS